MNKKTGEAVNYQAIGVDTLFVNSFGVETSITREIRLSKEQSSDAIFMRSLTDNHNKFIEVEIGVGDFKNIYVHKNNNIIVISADSQLSKVG